MTVADSRAAATVSWLAPGAVTALLVVIGYLWKAACALPGPLTFAEVTSRVCISDIPALWLTRGLSDHRFPYLDAVFTPPQGLTGAVEYPVLGGILIWAIGLGAQDALGFLTLNSIVLGACAVGVTFLLRGLTGRRVWLWAASPAVLLYVVTNWDAWAVLTATAAIAALVIARDRGSRSSGALALAGLLLGIGGALKLYPLLILLPLVCWVVFGERQDGRRLAAAVRRAALPVVTALAVLVACNLPIMLANFSGWLTPVQFQSARQLREDTMSVWYWVFRPFGDPARDGLVPTINTLTWGVSAIAIVVVLVVGWRIACRDHRYPFLAVALAVVTAFVLLGKVSSPQYLLWLIPLLAMTTIRWRWIAVVYIVDAIMFVSWYQVLGDLVSTPELSRIFQYVVAASVFIRFALLAGLALRTLLVGRPELPEWSARRAVRITLARVEEGAPA